MNAKKTGMCVLICPPPAGVLWDSRTVNIILMMCFNSEERYIFNKIYEPLTMILSEPENMKKILQVTSYNEFIDLLTTLII